MYKKPFKLISIRISKICSGAIFLPLRSAMISFYNKNDIALRSSKMTAPERLISSGSGAVKKLLRSAMLNFYNTPFPLRSVFSIKKKNAPEPAPERAPE